MVLGFWLHFELLAIRFYLARLGLALVLAFGLALLLALLGLAFDLVWCGLDWFLLSWLLALLGFWLGMTVLGF